jgi:transcriptional regulator with XRE-family HTH domain
MKHATLGTETFGQHLRRLRDDRGMTLVQLEKATRIANSNIAAMEADRKACGPIMAQRLAQGLRLHNEAHCVFISHAAKTTKRPLVMGDLSSYPPEVFHRLAAELQSAGVKGSTILKVCAPHHGTLKHVTTLELKDGRECNIHIHVRVH